MISSGYTSGEWYLIVVNSGTSGMAMERAVILVVHSRFNDGDSWLTMVTSR